MCAGTELADLGRLRLHILSLVSLLCGISIAAYIVSQLWLFTQQAQEEAGLVEAAGELRTLCITALFYARSSVLAAIDNHTELVGDLEHKASSLAERLQLQHLDNYDNIKRAAMKEAYVRKNITTMVPIGTHWKQRTISFWEMVGPAFSLSLSISLSISLLPPTTCYHIHTHTHQPTHPHTHKHTHTHTHTGQRNLAADATSIPHDDPGPARPKLLHGQH